MLHNRPAVYLSRLLLLISVLLLNVFTGFARQDLPTPIYHGIPHNESWSADSARFVFYDTNSTSDFEAGSTLSEPNWLEYTVSTNMLLRKSTWPLQPILSDEESQKFNLAVNSDGLQGFIFQSPNGRFLVFPQNTQDEFGRWLIAVADRQIGTVYTTRIAVFDPFYGPKVMQVRWSADSRSFVMEFLSDTGSPVFNYVTDYEAELSKLTVKWFSITLKGINFFPALSEGEHIYAISSNGQRVLLTSSSEVDGQPLNAIIWNPLSTEDSAVLDVDALEIKAMTFDRSDEDNLLILNNLGLVTYNIHTGKSTILSADFNGTTIRSASFSPNGEWLALSSNDSNLNIIDVKASPTT